MTRPESSIVDHAGERCGLCGCGGGREGWAAGEEGRAGTITVVRGRGEGEVRVTARLGDARRIPGRTQRGFVLAATAGEGRVYCETVRTIGGDGDRGVGSDGPLVIADVIVVPVGQRCDLRAK
jgi:hypothetical protein